MKHKILNKSNKCPNCNYYKLEVKKKFGIKEDKEGVPILGSDGIILLSQFKECSNCGIKIGVGDNDES